MPKQLKLCSDGGICGTRNANEGIVAPVVGSGRVYVWREFGLKPLCWSVSQEFGFSRREEVFMFSLFYKYFCKDCTWNDNAAINCITV